MVNGWCIDRFNTKATKILYCCLLSLDSFRFYEKYFTAPPRFVANTECDFSILERNALQGNVASLPCSSASSEYDVDKHEHNWLISTLCSETKHGVSLDLHHFEHWSFTYLVWKCIPAPPAQRPAQTPNSGGNKRDISRPIFRAMNLHMACLPTLPPPKNHREIAKKIGISLSWRRRFYPHVFTSSLRDALSESGVWRLCHRIARIFQGHESSFGVSTELAW